MTSASVSASKPLLLLFHSAISLSLINQAFFLLSRSFSGLKRRDWWLGTGMHRVDAAAKKEAGPDEFLWNSSDSASYFLCSFSLGHLDESGWDENKWCSRPTKNHPLVYPKIDLPGREKTKPLSLFIAAILQLSLLYSTFNFPIQWVSAFVSASKPLLPLFHSAIPSKPYKPSLFPVFLIVFWIVKGAWEGLGMGCVLG